MTHNGNILEHDTKLFGSVEEIVTDSSRNLHMSSTDILHYGLTISLLVINSEANNQLGSYDEMAMDRHTIELSYSRFEHFVTDRRQDSLIITGVSELRETIRQRPTLDRDFGKSLKDCSCQVGT